MSSRLLALHVPKGAPFVDQLGRMSFGLPRQLGVVRALLFIAVKAPPADDRDGKVRLAGRLVADAAGRNHQLVRSVGAVEQRFWGHVLPRVGLALASHASRFFRSYRNGS